MRRNKFYNGQLVGEKFVSDSSFRWPSPVNYLRSNISSREVTNRGHFCSGSLAWFYLVNRTMLPTILCGLLCPPQINWIRCNYQFWCKWDWRSTESLVRDRCEFGLCKWSKCSVQKTLCPIRQPMYLSISAKNGALVSGRSVFGAGLVSLLQRSAQSHGRTRSIKGENRRKGAKKGATRRR